MVLTSRPGTGIAGTGGLPTLSVSGSFCTGDPQTVTLHGFAASAPITLVAGWPS